MRSLKVTEQKMTHFQHPWKEGEFGKDRAELSEEKRTTCFPRFMKDLSFSDVVDTGMWNVDYL